MIKLSPETPEEGWEVETLYDLCFAPGREGLSSYRLRDGVAPVAGLSHVARDEFGELAGAIRYWPVLIEPVQTSSGRAQAFVLCSLALWRFTRHVRARAWAVC